MGKASQKKWEQRLVRVAAIAVQSQSSISHPALHYLRGAGLGSLLVGVGLALFVVWFWIGISILYFGLLIWTIDIWFAERLNRTWRGFLSMCPIIFVILLSIWVSSPAPLSIIFNRHNGNYQKGTVIGGIEWKESYSELRLILINQTGKDYDDFNALLNTDLAIATTGWIQQPMGCALDIAVHENDMRAEVFDPTGRPYLDVPLLPVFKYGPYRLHCEKVTRDTSIEIVFALVTPGKDRTEKFGPKTLPKWAAAEITYKSLFRPYSLRLEERFDKPRGNSL